MARQASHVLNSEPPVSKCQYSTHYFTQALDHFSETEKRTFQQRYLVHDAYWKTARKGPILLYTGNEGDIVWFAANTVSGIETATKRRVDVISIWLSAPRLCDVAPPHTPPHL